MAASSSQPPRLTGENWIYLPNPLAHRSKSPFIEQAKCMQFRAKRGRQRGRPYKVVCQLRHIQTVLPSPLSPSVPCPHLGSSNLPLSCAFFPLRTSPAPHICKA
ncbi:unnamed protein product [Ectocarpus sp. 12 AP-2014]